MAIGTYISIITLNVNVNTPNKRHRLAEWMQNKTHTYNIYKKHTSDLKRSKPQVRSLQTSLQTTYRQSERMEKYVLCKREAKESWSSNPHLRQNRR